MSPIRRHPAALTNTRAGSTPKTLVTAHEPGADQDPTGPQLVLTVREGGTVQRRACCLALGVATEGERRPRHPDRVRRRVGGFPRRSSPQTLVNLLRTEKRMLLADKVRRLPPPSYTNYGTTSTQG